ncbi:MAG: DUF5615 family PIN-like protein [Candidatus Margulisbacteria bacterium]|nr:DUF5615 family PIN-like protein [Candidatus Margulisiibacteriota bacterium]
MKFLLDENLPIETVAVLREIGCDVKNVHDLKLAGKSDEKIIEVARKEKRILITLDLDFSNILNYPPKSHPGIIVLRLDNPNRKNIINTIKQFLKIIKTEEIKRSLIILEDKEYRIRK